MRPAWGCPNHADAEAAEAMQPAEEPLHQPTHFFEPAAVLPLAPPEFQLDAPPRHLLAVRVSVVGGVCEQLVGPPSGPARLASDPRDGIHDFLQLGDIAGAGRAQVPARDLAWSQRRQRLPEPQPISRGKSFQRMPVFRTNRR
jgi:hypothetical protein